MVFAFATDDGTLHVFPSESEAVVYCEGVDVEEGAWLFFAADGSALEVEFHVPNKKGSVSVVSGTYSLKAAPHKSTLQQQLSKIRAVHGEGLSSVEDIRRLLKA
jgi:hypothetical protein